MKFSSPVIDCRGLPNALSFLRVKQAVILEADELLFDVVVDSNVDSSLIAESFEIEEKQLRFLKKD